MIAGSLLLILVAVGLLVLGLASGSSLLLVASIVASLLAAVALVMGARQAAATRAAASPDGESGTGWRDRSRSATRSAWRRTAPQVPTQHDPMASGAGGTGWRQPPGSPASTPPSATGHRPGRVDDAPAGPGPDPYPDPADGPFDDGLTDHRIRVDDPYPGGDPYPSAAPLVADGPRASGDGYPAGDPYSAAPATADPLLTAADPFGADGPFQAGDPVRVDDPYRASDPLLVVDPEDDEPPAQPVQPAEAVLLAGLATEVLVIDGRPRYHLAQCPHLLGREGEPLPVAEAVELGFTPCAQCAPVTVLLAGVQPS